MTIGERSSAFSSLPPEFHRAHKPAILLWLLAFLFFMRVLAQALQRWIPSPYLPPFDAFQGSRLPYWLLLSAQLAILASMAWCCWRIQRGTLRAQRRTGNMLAWIGGAYMSGSLLRIVAGLVLPTAPAWFSAWIPAFFHVVLAGFVLTLSCYHLHFCKSPGQESPQ